MQQLPRDSEFRECFEGQDDYLLVDADYSQIEVRIAAELSKERRLIEIYHKEQAIIDQYSYDLKLAEDQRKNYDVYASTARLLNNLTELQYLALPKEKQKLLRQQAKAVVLGFIFAMGAKKFKNYAKFTYNVSFTYEAARKYRYKFFNTYTSLQAWHETNVKYAETYGEIRNKNGRVRYGEIGYNEAINYPVQSLSADITKTALGNLYFDLKSKGYSPTQSRDIKMIATVHDQIVLEAKPHLAEFSKEMLSSTMISAAKEYITLLPVQADSNIGKNWAESH